MRLKDLTTEEILKRVLNSEKLRDEFDEAIQEREMDYINDMLSHFNTRCADWSVGPWNPSYLKCNEASEYVYCAREMVDVYGGSVKTLKALSHAEKLRGTNLFEHYADKLARCIESDLKEICRGIEQTSYDIYCRKETDVLLDYCEMFAEWAIDDVMIDEEGELYKTVKL